MESHHHFHIELPHQKAPFIAVNIRLYATDSIQEIENKIKNVKNFGFTHIWFNPICEVETQTICVRRDLDTGIQTELYNSLYAPTNPKNLVFRKDTLKKIISIAKEENIQIMIDFVWKHVGMNSRIFDNHKEWKGK